MTTLLASLPVALWLNFAQSKMWLYLWPQKIGEESVLMGILLVLWWTSVLYPCSLTGEVKLKDNRNCGAGRFTKWITFLWIYKKYNTNDVRFVHKCSCVLFKSENLSYEFFISSQLVRSLPTFIMSEQSQTHTRTHTHTLCALMFLHHLCQRAKKRHRSERLKTWKW